MKKIIIILVLILLLLAGCIKNPVEPGEELDEFLFCWQYLRLYFIFQERLPEDPTIYDTPAELYSSLNEPWTGYISPLDLERYLSHFSTENTSGLGIFIDSKGDTFFVKHVIKNSPAQAAGLLKGDRLIKADGINLVGISRDTLFMILTGKEGTDITLEVLRDTTMHSITVTRGPFSAPTVISDSLHDSIGYIWLKQFLYDTPDSTGTIGEFKACLDSTKKFPITILDIRGNPGGFVHQVMPVCDEFLDSGLTIIKAMEREAVNEAHGITQEVIYSSDAGGAALTRRFIVLVDSNTASAAEILAASLMDNRSDIVIMGVNTRGKARGQVPVYTPAGGMAKITSMTLTTSRDYDYNEIGLAPHVPLDNSEDWLEAAYNRALSELGISAKMLAGTRLQLKNLELNRKLMMPGPGNDFPLIVRKDGINEKTHKKR